MNKVPLTKLGRSRASTVASVHLDYPLRVHASMIEEMEPVIGPGSRLEAIKQRFARWEAKFIGEADFDSPPQT